jgi:anti-sigma regulatory factor (Ser/Thr protein kinase)
MTLYNTFFDIRKLLEEVRNVFSMRVALKGMKYVLDLDKRFPQAIKTDEVRLRQILINLVGNAVKFTHQGEIRIVVRSQIVRKAIKPTIRLEMRVIDTGIGIPENSFRIIFESFRQHSQLNSRKYGGTGLGLAITKHLVEVMKGEITVASQLNQGSTFTIVFPEVEYAQVLSDTLEDSYLSPESTQLYELSDLQLIDTRRRQNNFNDQQELGMIDASDYQVLVNRLEQDLAAQWRLYKQKQPLKEIQAFAREIINLGQTYKLTFISDYGQQLLTTMQNFDVEEMRLKLELFPQLLAHLKKDRS